MEYGTVTDCITGKQFAMCCKNCEFEDCCENAGTITLDNYTKNTEIFCGSEFTTSGNKYRFVLKDSLR